MDPKEYASSVLNMIKDGIDEEFKKFNESDKSRHFLSVKYRDPQNWHYIRKSYIITCPEMNYTLPLSFIRIITS
jgi:hypothetical protein